MQCILVSTICGPIGCAVDFLCRLLHLEIILPKKPLRTALCNKAGMRPNVLLDKCNWSLLRIFRVIVQEGSLNKAAIKLFLTQSAISQSLKRLEEQIGETLIIRTGGKFYLTETGEIVFEASMMIYSQLMDYEERLNTEKNSLSGTIKLLVLSGFVAQSCS